MAVNSDSQHADDPCGIAYKEWAGVCRALGSGRQTILMRKGGIAEENGVFRPEHPRFWLYPTNLHEEQQGIRDPAPPRTFPRDGTIELEFLAEVESVSWVDRMEVALNLCPYHVWTEATIRKRFDYRRPGLWVLAVRVFRLPKPVILPELPEYAGCKTWVRLERPIPRNTPEPVLPEATARGQREALERLLFGASEHG